MQIGHLRVFRKETRSNFHENVQNNVNSARCVDIFAFNEINSDTNVSSVLSFSFLFAYGMVTR